SPTGDVTVALSMEDTNPPATDPRGGGTCDPVPASGCSSPSYTVAITPDWTVVTIPWASFKPGVGGGGRSVVPNGDRVTGIVFSAGMVYGPDPNVDGGYIPTPGAF